MQIVCFVVLFSFVVLNDYLEVEFACISIHLSKCFPSPDGYKAWNILVLKIKVLQRIIEQLF